MNEQWSALVEKLPAYLGGHLELSLAALAIGLLISLPLGVFAARRPALAEWALAVAGVIQTVPSLALLALLVLLLGGLIGFVPAFIALTLYGVLPMLANTIAGIRGVDPNLIEAARGLGMNPRQVLFRVQLPIAAPVILAGVRTSTVLVVGTATLVTPVGGVSLGNYIFSGLESLNHLSTVFGCVLAAVLAILLDQLIRLLELSQRKGSRRLAYVALAGLFLVVAGGLAGPTQRLLRPDAEEATIATGPFTEQSILDEVLAQRLEESNMRVERRPGTSEGIQFQALFHSQIDCMVNYAGNIWTLLMKRTDFPDDRAAMLAEIRDYLKREHDVECLGSLGFQNAYALAVTSERAEALREGPDEKPSLEKLASHAAQYRRRTGKRFVIGGDYQIFGRPEWRRVKERYGLRDEDIEEQAMGATLMYGAVQRGQVQAIVAYTSDGRIPAYDLVILEDPRKAFPPYDALILLSPKASRRPELRAALLPLVDSITEQDMRTANGQVDMHGWTAKQAARDLRTVKR